MKPEELIQYFKPRFKCRINYGLILNTVEQLLEDWLDENYDLELDFDVYLPTYGRNLQRELCWSPRQKSELIISILKEVNIPPLTIVQVRDRKADNPMVWQIIDGKQRLTTVIGFLRNEFPIVVEGSEYYYKDLPEELQKMIKWFSFHANVVYSNIYYDNVDEKIKEREFVTDKDKVELYLYLNYSGTPQEQEFMKDLVELVR